MDTKWRISEADVPTYRLPSSAGTQYQRAVYMLHNTDVDLYTPELHASNLDI